MAWKRRRVAWICVILSPSALVLSFRLWDKQQHACSRADDGHACSSFLQDSESSEVDYRSSSFEDMSTHDLVHALSSDTSPMWLAMADMIADEVSAEPATSLLQVNQSMAGEHHLVRRMWRKIHKVPAQAGKAKQEEAGTCAWLPKAEIEKQVSDITEMDTPTSSKKRPERQNLRDLEGISTAASPSMMDQLFARFNKALRKALEAAAQAGKSIKYFFYQYLRWDLSFPFFGTSFDPQKWGPVLGFKCQPIRDCIVTFLAMTKDVLKFIAVIVWEVVKLFWDLCKHAASRIGFDAGNFRVAKAAKDLANRFRSSASRARLWVSKRFSRSEGDSDSELSATFKMSKEDASLENVEVGEVAVDTNRIGKDPCIKNLRLKGSISFSIMNFAGFNLKFVFGTVPLPIEKWKGEAVTCGSKIRSVFSKLLSSKKGKNADLYFASEQCNPHTVGLCMLLEKTRQCKIKLGKDGIESQQITSQETGKAMKEFCNAFGGVSLNLTKTVEDGRVRCPASLGAHARFDKTKTQVFDFGIGCHKVSEHMKHNGANCNPASLEETFLYCRRLFGCSHHRSSPHTLLKWESYVSRVMDTVSHFVDITKDGDTMRRVSERVQSVARQGEEFQAQVSAAMASEPANDDLDPESLFKHPLWNDKCFDHLNPVSKKEGGSKVKLPIGRSSARREDIRHGLHGMFNRENSKSSEQQPFFHSLAQKVNTYSWHTCQPSAASESLNRDAKVSTAAATSQFLVKLSDGLQSGPNYDEFTLVTPGWASTPTKTTLKKTECQGRPLWKVAFCHGRHCSDMKEGVELLSLRVQMADHERMTSICDSASAVLKTISEVKNVGSEIPGIPFLSESEENFVAAAEVLETNAKVMENNAKIADDENLLPETIYWDAFATMLGQKSVDYAYSHFASTDDPFERGKTTMDEYVHSRYIDDHPRNKLAMFLRRQDWALVRSRDDDNLVLEHNGEVATVSQIRGLATALKQPRNGAVVSIGIALHSLAVDLLNGVNQKVFLIADSFKDAAGVPARDNIQKWIEEVQSLNGTCNLALVTVDYSLIPRH